MKLKKEAVLRDIAGEYILVVTDPDVKSDESIFALNETSAAAFRVLEQGGDESDMVKAVLEEYDVDEATAAADIAELVDTLKKYGFV